MTATSTTGPAETARRVSGLRLSYALFAGILAWLAHLVAQAGLNGYACHTGQLWPLHAATAGLLVLTLHALWVSVGIARVPSSTEHLAAARFLGFVAVFLNVFNAVLVVVEWLPVLFIHPCAVG